MPLYEYKCDNCRTEFEVLTKIEEETTCPLCDGKSLTKKISTFSTSTSAAGPQNRSCSSSCGGEFGQNCCS